MDYIPTVVASISMIGPDRWWIVGLLAILGHGQQTKPVTAGGARFALPAFGESRKRVGTEKAGEFMAALVALVVGWMGNPPSVLMALVTGSIFLFVLDYTTAHHAARLAGESITTRKIREMTAAKLQSYWISAGVVVCLGVMVRSWLPIIGIFGWIAYCEALSNLENVRKMALASGESGSRFYGGVLKLSNRFLGELPGVEQAQDDKAKQEDENEAVH